ncbi:MAG: YfhO family protein, partial [Dehalococcoidia bacterium]|nr:YfhO family protein [Dehalococcoidia bacterium]
ELSIRYLGRGGPGVRPAQGQLALRGLSLIDGRTGASESLVPDPGLLRVHSGDLKVYQNLDWAPRAFIAGGVWARDDQEALSLLRQSLVRLVLTGPQAPDNSAQAGFPASLQGTGQAIIQEYLPEYVRIRAETAETAYLVLTDSYYPGWRAYLDGLETPIIRAQHIFRAVYLPPGVHQVEFRFEPASFQVGLALSLASLGLLVAGAAGCLWHGGRGRRDSQP